MESKKAQKALDYFFGGYNCAQSVFAAFHEEMGLGEAEALRDEDCLHLADDGGEAETAPPGRGGKVFGA